VKHDYGDLIREAGRAEAFRSLIDPRAARFLKPGDMPQRIVNYCKETHQQGPETPGEFVRCILESLALLYRLTIEEIQKATGQSIHRLHIVGGGSQNTLLNEFAANATERQVVAGPAEATAIGNVLIQAVALGHVQSLAALREVVRDSFSLQTFEPRTTAEWQAAYQRFLRLEAFLR
jgi:rhamnulokinase